MAVFGVGLAAGAGGGEADLGGVAVGVPCSAGLSGRSRGSAGGGGKGRSTERMDDEDG